MHERPDTGGESSGRDEGGEPRRRHIDLSVPQVAGSAVAAVVAAKLASYFGVYGTILGAGVVSVVATCGGSLFQHFFSRTGEQIRGAAVAAKPEEQAPPAPGQFTEGTVYRARIRGRRRPVLAAALVFGLALAGITTYELVSGHSFGGGTGTTVSDAVRGSTSSKSRGDFPPSSPATPASPDAPASPSSYSSPSATHPAGTGGSPGSDGATAGGPTPAPSGSPQRQQDGRTDPAPAATPTPSGSATDPAPSASGRSGTAVPDPAGPATP
ncbi:hypothetical protein [Streptomyces sp. NPDC004629]|uniref:hypothetical protein n=1 Tax=Streptomyces sp. NPDC004629 TaxID=3364705 RepID=UPI0036B6B53B